MRAIRLCLLLLTAWLSGCGSAGAEAPTIALELHARALSPGEPLRIVASSSQPLRSLSGRFLNDSLFLVSDEERRQWTGWAMIGLDQEPGPTSVELLGVGPDGEPVGASRALTIQAKQFPVERLRVAPKYVEPPKAVQDRLARERATLAALYQRRRASVPDAVPFVRPVHGEPTSTFGTRRLYNDQPRSPHPGLDLRANDGTPVRSAGEGLVVLAEDLYYSGNTVIVDHGAGLFTIYAHLSRIDVAADDAVEAGAPIGLSGATGRVTGPHLHWGAKIGDKPFDPTALLDAALFE